MVSVVDNDGNWLTDIDIIKFVCSVLMHRAYKAGKNNEIDEDHLVDWTSGHVDEVFKLLDIDSEEEPK